MRIKLIDGGRLKIEKRGRFVNQFCPFSFSSEGVARCSESCPLFFVDEEKQQLHLCKSVWNYSELIEEE